MKAKTKLFSFLIILLGSFLAYGNTLSHDFVWDDLILIVDSAELRKWSNVGAFFTTPFFKLAANIDFPHHRPMVSLLILLTSSFSGTNPFGYHFLSVCLHAAVTWLFFLFLQKITLSRKVSMLTAAVFLFHPAHVEAVAWPCSTTVLAGGIFFLSGLLYSHKLRTAGGDARALCLLGTAASYGLGLLSYDLVLTLPALILLYDFFKFGSKTEEKPRKWKILEFSILCFLALDFLWMRYSLTTRMGGFARFQHGDVNATNVILGPGAGEPFTAVLNTFSRYLEILIFPYNLNPEVYFRAGEFSTSALACLILFVLGSILALIKREDKKPVCFSLGWLTITLLPLGQLIFQGGLFADRYLYFASMAFSLWLVLVLQTLWNLLQKNKALNPKIAATSAVFLCLLYGGKTFSQNKIWRDDLTFWSHAVLFSPDKPRTHHLLGVSLLRFGHPEEAIESFGKAIKLAPLYPHPYKGIAIALREMGKTQEADQVDRQADQIYQMQAQAIHARS